MCYYLWFVSILIDLEKENGKFNIFDNFVTKLSKVMVKFVMRILRTRKEIYYLISLCFRRWFIRRAI